MYANSASLQTVPIAEFKRKAFIICDQAKRWAKTYQKGNRVIKMKSRMLTKRKCFTKGKRCKYDTVYKMMKDIKKHEESETISHYHFMRVRNIFYVGAVYF